MEKTKNKKIKHPQENKTIECRKYKLFLKFETIEMKNKSVLSNEDIINTWNLVNQYKEVYYKAKEECNKHKKLYTVHKLNKNLLSKEEIKYIEKL